ncbi:ABC-2 family transporter protein, partial [candidate division KSB1 bacterium]|nr:ABC-2 family transporter protein [candidate division KSB1 bacterium]
YPALLIIGRRQFSDATVWLQWLSPGVGMLFLFLSLQIWKFGVRHYRSTGS